MAFEIDFLVSHDAETIITELKRVAVELGKPTLSAADIDTHSRVTYDIVRKQFGGLRNALIAAGLAPGRFTNASDVDLIKLVAEVWEITRRESGRRPRTGDLIRYGIPVSAMTIIKRFGSWKNAMVAAAQWSQLASGGAAPEGLKVQTIRRVIPVATRYLILKRDTYRCQICNRAGVELEVDHIVPVSQGGSDNVDNLQTACRDCNRGKGGQLQ
jgi:hypothetical protein